MKILNVENKQNFLNILFFVNTYIRKIFVKMHAHITKLLKKDFNGIYVKNALI
jgi:hypothetical protein